MRMIAEGFELNKMSDAENLFAEGDTGEVRLYLDRSIDTGVLEERILSEGVILTDHIRQDAGVISIKFQKQIAPLLIIVVAIGAVLVAGFLGWQIFKPAFLAPLGIPVWMWMVGGGAVFYLMVRKPAVRAAKTTARVVAPAVVTYLVAPGTRAVRAKTAIAEEVARRRRSV